MQDGGVSTGAREKCHSGRQERDPRGGTRRQGGHLARHDNPSGRYGWRRQWGSRHSNGCAGRAFMPSRLQGSRCPQQVWLLRAARGNGRGHLGGLPTRHGRHAAQLPLPEEFRIIGRQLRPLQRDVQYRTGRRRRTSTLPGSRGKARLQNASGRIEGLLLLDLRQAVGIEQPVSRQRQSGPSGWP